MGISDRAGIKDAALLLYLLLDLPALAGRIAGLDGVAGAASYAVLYGGLAGALWLAGRVAWGPARWGLAAVLTASAAFLSANERVFGSYLSYDLFLTMIGSAGFADDALAQHGRRIVGGVLCALPLLPALGLAPRGRLRFGWPGVAAPFAALLALTGLLWIRGGEGTRGLPTAYAPLAFGLLALVDDAGAVGVPEPVRMTPRPPARGGDIVMLIDESIAATYLDISDPAGVRTGLRMPPPGIAVANFGIAAAISACSLGSNVTLRHGGTRADYRRMNAVAPTIWAYARRAGYRTSYVDAQRTGGALQNRMTSAERAGIDRFVQFDAVPVRDRDQAAALTVRALIADDTRDFVLVNKLGGHFPVADKYPDARAAYRPASPRTGAATSDTGDRTGFAGDRESWRRYRNAYRNTLLWNVGDFFARLLAGGLNGATILYTADHGQDLHEDGRDGVTTHCSPDPAPAEGAVPLAVLTPAADGARWDAAAVRNRDRASHHQIFPTLLALMGYPAGPVTARYGASLLDPLHDEMRFNTLFNARLGREPVWRAIDPAALPRPPREDRAAGPAIR